MIKLNSRLLTVSECAREDVVLYDVGTDHAYLPVYLVQSGKTRRAVASDISEGPISHARDIIAENGLSDKIETILSNGLDRIALEYPCDVAVAGMGGDTIISIIDKKAGLRDERAHLLLQPMTKQYEVRKYLLENGFDIYDERLAEDGGRIFQIICAEYIGKSRDVSDFELMLGVRIEERYKKGECPKGFLLNRYETLRTRLDGKAMAGLDAEFEREICERIAELLK